MHIEEFNFDLPDDLVAQYPAERRDASRLMALDRQNGGVEHLLFADIVERLRPEDVLVLNETRVVRARLRGHKERTGGRVELLLLRRDPKDGTWLALARPLRGLQSGDWIQLDRGSWRLKVVGRVGDRIRLRMPADAHGGAVTDCADPTGHASVLSMEQEAGDIPLPPYIRRAPESIDSDRYQTVFATTDGSIAAPTAGLHFTEQLLTAVRDRGVGVERLLLHVGPGTFEPVRTEDPRQHQLEAEFYRVSATTANCIAERRRAGGRCIAVGTTTVRTLETCAMEGEVRAGEGWTDLLICPPHEFNVVDAMVTNFHLPRSSLLLLVSALAGQQPLLAAYQLAVAERYRFYSYGDAMFIH
ncbi:MAG TPA: tRNA preQ1(34) S-adenosylmethionine ribosyltransferase-isomerase QueA [Candidatus Latescibacteria bacterium]|jgi:S-adenosylmethionine:tRNA ribosyltransferase-isomerase|nr:tRNA preQ1(34) S-adenosylmethionine ribosyltransferase-isomerase QueA [Candidatus Latescibacterota bacterium]